MLRHLECQAFEVGKSFWCHAIFRHFKWSVLGVNHFESFSCILVVGIQLLIRDWESINQVLVSVQLRRFDDRLQGAWQLPSLLWKVPEVVPARSIVRVIRPVRLVGIVVTRTVVGVPVAVVVPVVADTVIEQAAGENVSGSCTKKTTDDLCSFDGSVGIFHAWHVTFGFVDLGLFLLLLLLVVVDNVRDILVRERSDVWQKHDRDENWICGRLLIGNLTGRRFDSFANGLNLFDLFARSIVVTRAIEIVMVVGPWNQYEKLNLAYWWSNFGYLGTKGWFLRK